LEAVFGWPLCGYGIVVLFMVYGKNEKANLTAEDKKVVARIMGENESILAQRPIR